MADWTSERARSISPTKEQSFNGGLPSSIRSTVDSTRHEDIIKSPVTFQPPEASFEMTMGGSSETLPEVSSKRRRPSPPRDLPQPPSKPATLSKTPPSTAMAPTRAGTLSWQQRPSSRGSTGPRARPLSQVAAENSASRSPRASVEPPSKNERELSKDEIAESLASKDPAWFRQTQERGLGSAAYRRNQKETGSDSASMTESMRLPGMSRESTTEPERQGSPAWGSMRLPGISSGSGRQGSPASEGVRSMSPPREGSTGVGSFGPSKHTASASLSSSNSLRSPLPIMSSHIFEPPVSQPAQIKDNDRLSTNEMIPTPLSQGRISPERLERSPSPTKGLGGFVQSAMLKRSDSVSKRWSAQPGAGLSRGNSIASNRSGYEASKYGITGLSALKDQAPILSSRDHSPVATSRPGLSHSTVNLSEAGKENHRPGPSGNLEPRYQIEPLVHNSATPTISDEESRPDLEENGLTRARTKSETSPPSSPSKRWSPTKSSWLENAINKPETPKPKMPPPQQPSWMTSLNQAKQQKGGPDPGRSNNFKEVSVGGLLRSPPMGAVSDPSRIGGLNGRPTAGPFELPRTASFKGTPPPQAGHTKPLRVSETSQEPSPQPEKATMTDISDLTPPRTASTASTPSNPLKSGSKAEPGQEKASSPQLFKPKPETPPKKDFRSNLKPRQASGERKPTEEAEFKNVFGKLKRTQTQNYVAPDELKGNILRGKAGLSVTGGPKKTERLDEFKESLLKQKEAIKAGPPPAVGRKPSAGNTPNTQGSPQATAIANGKPLVKSEISSRNTSANNGAQPEVLVGLQRLKGKSQPTADSTVAAPTKQRDPLPDSKQGLDFNSSLAGMLARRPSPLTASNRPTPKATFETAEVESGPETGGAFRTAAEGPPLTHMTKARARGPKRRLPTVPDAEEDIDLQQARTALTDRSSPDLSEVRSQSRPVTESLESAKKEPQMRPLATISNNHRKPSQPPPPRKASLNVNKADSFKSPPSTTQIFPPNPNSLQPKSPPPAQFKSLSTEFSQPQESSTSVAPPSSTPSTTSRIQNKEKESMDTVLSRITQTKSEPEKPSTPPSVKGAAATWGHGEVGGRSLPTRIKSPIKLPTRKDEESAMQDAGLLPKKEAPIGLGIDSRMQLPRSSAPDQHNLPTPPLTSPKSPPLPGNKPPSIANRVASKEAASPLLSKINGTPTSQTSEAARLFAELFDESPNNELKVNVDTPAVLSSRSQISEANKIRTLRKQLWEVTAGGKLIPVQSDQSHILFEDSLYICHHVFGSLSGTRTTEIYLWCGDGVATSAVEDAQIFARKEAKDYGGKLIVLAQGKETANLFQALGGIVITRHGQSDRASSRYMLCGRRHIGHVAFDEVEFSSRSLCKGFPYLISSGSGKIYLWKGRGSGVDELGCARLIGMDLGVRGEIEEVEDGGEAESFWKIFPAGQQHPSADGDSSCSKHWQLKRSSERYVTRLYQVDIEAPRPKSSSGFMWGRRGSAPASEESTTFTAQIKEIAPFAQFDVFNDGVFVLDTFFEIFVYFCP